MSFSAGVASRLVLGGPGFSAIGVADLAPELAELLPGRVRAAA